MLSKERCRGRVCWASKVDEVSVVVKEKHYILSCGVVELNSIGLKLVRHLTGFGRFRPSAQLCTFLYTRAMICSQLGEVPRQ